MASKKILWLCSWYPNKLEPFNGDFIQRHAKAASLYNEIFLIHVIGDITGNTEKKSVEIRKEKNLTEHISYFKKSTSLPGRFIAHFRLSRIYRNVIREYIEQNGKPDLVHVHIPVKAGIFALWIKKRYKLPYVLTEHWGIYNDVEQMNYAMRSKHFRFYTKLIFKNAAKFISVSKYLAEGVNRLVIKKEYEIIPNVVNTSLFYYKPGTASSFRFIHVSNMVPLKNAEGILRAFKIFSEKNKSAELVMVGDTNTSIRKYAEELGLNSNRVRFCGEVPYEQVAKEMQQADCFILFSNIENSPCVIGEALCCGLPVIATNVGGVPELLDESNGILIEPKSEAGLADAMMLIIDNYNSYDKNKIAEFAKNKFSYDIAGKKTDDIYASVLSATGNK